MPGAWGHAIGGMGAITQAMAKACREAGVDIVLNAPVSEIIVEKGRGAGRGRGRQELASADHRCRRQSQAAVRPAGAQGRGQPPGRRAFRHWGCESATFRMNVALDKLPKFTVAAGQAAII